MGILDLSRDQFLSAVSELAAQGVNTDDLVRQYRRQNSPFAAAYDWADRAASNVADRGREAGFFGLLSKPEGASGMEAIRNLRVEPQNFAAGLLGGVAQAVDAPSAAAMGLIPSQDMPMEAINTAGMTQLGGAAMPAPSGALRAGALRSFDVTRKDASNIFGAGTERIRYTDPASGGTMEVVVRPNGSASVLELEVPEASRGQGVGQALQERVLQDYPVMGGQVSSKAAATTAYRIGRRPYGMPDATLDDVFRMIDEDSSVNLISQKAQPVTLPAARNEAEAMARQILDMRAAGRAGEVTDAMMAQADPQYMFSNTPLPMDEASRMVRAAEMGFDTELPLYHGTGADFQRFDPARFQQSDFGTGGAGVYSSESSGLAGAYANLVTRPSNDNANILPIVARRQETYDTGGYRNINNYEQAREYSRRMQELGFDNVYYRDNMSGEIVENVTFDPRNIRSRFARFDPEFSHLANLNAANASPLAGILAMPNEEERRLGLLFGGY
jgi:hypothetical protein